MKNEKLDEIMKKRGIHAVAPDDGADRRKNPRNLSKGSGGSVFAEV